MAVHPLTRSALAILHGLVKASPNGRKGRMALAQLERELFRDGERLVGSGLTTNARLVSTTPCEIHTARAAEPTVMTADSLEPSAREVGVFFQGLMAARRHGIVLRSTWHFAWVDCITGGDWDATEIAHNSGTADIDDDGVVRIELRRGLSDYDLFRTVVHELAHARDMTWLGREAHYARFSEAEREARAGEFERRVMAAEWRPGIV